MVRFLLILMVATRVSRTFPTPRSIPWPPLFLLFFQPCVHVGEPLVANVNEWLDEGDAAQVDRLDGQAKFLFLPAGV
jgi:hypothetical protein